jgi:shikimate kinase
MEIEAVSHGTAVIVDATNRGAVFAIDLKANASAKIFEDRRKIEADDKAVRDVASKVLDFFGYDYGLEIKTESEIPPDKGFGEKEAISTATALSVVGALAKKHGSVNELRIDLHLRDQFIVVEGKLVDKRDLIGLCVDSGMRFDRIYSSFYGGFVVADNKKKKVLRMGGMEILQALILIPGKRGKAAGKEFSMFQNQFDVIFQEALKGNLYTAMNMNSIFYGRELLEKMLSAGALAASGSVEGGFVGLVRDGKKIKKVKDSIGDNGEILVRDVVNQQARIQVKPKKIYKINEFMELKGKQEYHWL